jgi:hypothetical protein
VRAGAEVAVAVDHDPSGAGAAVFSDFSRFYAETFIDGRDIALFRWKALDAGMARLAALSADPDIASEQAGHGAARVLAAHRWAHRIDPIIVAMEASRRRLGL